MNGARSMASQNDPDVAFLESVFPGLSLTAHSRTSDSSPDYNCLAWAIGETHRWWESYNLPGYHWPNGIKGDGSVKSVIKALRLSGFVRCKDGTIEEQFEKLAIYGESGEFMHIARQLADGKWTSKFGKSIDMSHDNAECLCGDEYGAVEAYMRRERNNDGKKETGEHDQ